MNKAYFKQLNKFAANTEISRDEAIEMIMSWYEPFKIYTRKLDGTRMIRDNVFTFAGPSGNVKYDYAGKGYMIIQSDPSQSSSNSPGDQGFRTIVFRNVYRIDKGGKTYIVK